VRGRPPEGANSTETIRVLGGSSKVNQPRLQAPARGVARALSLDPPMNVNVAGFGGYEMPSDLEEWELSRLPSSGSRGHLVGAIVACSPRGGCGVR
jgi:hypothetical protein